MYILLAGGEVVKLGNELIGPKETTVGAGLSGKSFLIYDHPVTRAGLVFGFAAYIQKQTPVIFQVLRPVDSTHFELIRQWQFTPTVTEGIEKVN